MQVRIILISLALTSALAGCVHEERFTRTMRLPSSVSQQAISQFIIQHPELPPEHRTALAENRITIGMSRKTVETLCGDQISKYSDYVWVLKQRESFEPGIYPYFDSSTARLYWLDDELAAIIFRREYNVYP